jgi:hypothetical protein
MDTLRNIVIRVNPEVRQWIKQVALNMDMTLKDLIIESVKNYENLNSGAEKEENNDGEW